MSEVDRAQIMKIAFRPENSRCTDCGRPGPTWASITLACFLCKDCVSVHRALGSHISRVKSLEFDTWTDEEQRKMEDGGNKKCNEYFDARLPPFFPRPSPDEGVSPKFVREHYIRKKYVNGTFKPTGEPTQYDAKIGYCFKEGGTVKNWKKRLFKIYLGQLIYSVDLDSKVLGFIDLNAAAVCEWMTEEIPGHKNLFLLLTPKRTYKIECESPTDMMDWIVAIRATIHAATERPSAAT